MRGHLLRPVPLFLAISCAVMPHIARAQGTEAHVVLISLEGFSALRLEDETLELPNLRALVRSGVRAESSETVFPAIDDPAHTSIVTGVPPREHGVIGNRMLNRKTQSYFRVSNLPRAEAIRGKTLFDAAKEKGLRTAAFFWPGTLKDPSVDHLLAPTLTGDGRADASGTDTAFLDELRENGVAVDLFFSWFNELPMQTTADRVLTRAAAYVIRTYKPHLLAIRLPAPDHYQHQYGPEHYLSKAALTAADYNVGLLRRALENAGIDRNTTIFAVSDHGFHAVHYSVNVFPLFEEAGLAEKVNLHSGYWSVFVELGEDFDIERDGDALEDVFARAEALQGIDRVLRPQDLEALGLPRYEDDPHMLGNYLILGDIDTRATLDEGSTSTRREELGRPFYGHAALPSHSVMYPVFVVAGRGIKSGERVGHVHNYDIAPTVSELLGLSLEGLAGRVLTESLVQ